MHVLILEIGGSHIECTYSFLHLLKLKGHEVSLCCNEQLIKSFPEKDLLKNVLLVPNLIKANKQFSVLWSIRKFIVQHDITHLVINTSEIKLVRNLIFFIPKNVNCTGLVHNAKKLESSQTFVKLLSRKMVKYFVLGDYLLSKTTVNAIFKVHPFFPTYFPKPLVQNIEKAVGEFWVVVPGSVLQDRRDYIHFLLEMKFSNLSSNIRFIFLGNFSPTISPEAAQLLEETNNVMTFNSFINYDSFHNYMQLSDAILPLIKLEGDAMYADSRISGSYNLGLGYQLPFLLPQNMQANTDLMPYSLYYNSMRHLFVIINTLAANSIMIQSINDAYKSGPFATRHPFVQEVCDFIEL